MYKRQKYPCALKEGSESAKCYGESDIWERHRHRYEFNNKFRDLLSEKGLLIAGTSPNGKLVEIVEVPEHPWYVGCLLYTSSLSASVRAGATTIESPV